MLESTFSYPDSVSRGRLFNSVLACLLMFLAGSLFGLGFFAVPIENSASPPGALDGVWTSTIGLISLFSAPVTVFAGFYLDAGSTPSSNLSTGQIANWKTYRAQILCLLVSISYACLSLVAYGIQNTNAILIRCSATAMAVPLGVIYLLASELLMVWNPSKQGLATGFGQMALSCGSIIISSLYFFLNSLFGCVVTFYLLSIVFPLISGIPVLLMHWPSNQYTSPKFENNSNSECSETSCFFREQSVRLPWRKLRALPSFWLFLFVSFSSAVPFALLTFFFKIGYVFQQPSAHLLRYFQTSTLLSSVFSVFTIFLTDLVRLRSSFFFSGAKNLLIAMLIAQSLLYTLLTTSSISFNFVVFIFATMSLVIMTAAYSGCVAILARDMFGAANATIVFGIGAGLGMGAGEGLSTSLMSIVEGFQQGSVELTPASYACYYEVGVLWSLFGLVALLCTRKCKDAFEILPITTYESTLDFQRKKVSKSIKGK